MPAITVQRRRIGSALLAFAAALVTFAALPATPAAAAETIYVIKTRAWYRTCLDNDADTNANARSNLQVYTCRPSNSDQRFWQYWTLPHIPGQPDGIVQIRNYQSGKCATYTPWVTSVQKPVWMEACGLAGQGWRKVAGVDSAGNEDWKFYAVETNSLCLEALASGMSQAGVDLRPCSPSADYIGWNTYVQPGPGT